MTRREKLFRLGKQCRIAVDMLRLYCPFKEEFIDEIVEGLSEVSDILERYIDDFGVNEKQHP